MAASKSNDQLNVRDLSEAVKLALVSNLLHLKSSLSQAFKNRNATKAGVLAKTLHVREVCSWTLTVIGNTRYEEVKEAVLWLQ